MALSLRTIAFELERTPELERPRRVVRGPFDLSCRVEDVRLYDGGPLRPALLYVFDEALAPHPRDLERFAFVRAGSAEPGGAALALPDEPSALAAIGALQDVLLRYRTWERALDASVIAGEGVQRLVDLATPFTRNHLVVVDPALKLLAHSRDIACDDPITVELVAHGYHTDENIKKFKLNKRFEPWATQGGFIVNDTRRICRYTTVVHSFKTRQSFSMIVVMMCNAVDPDEGLLDAFSLLLARIEFYARRDYPEDKPSGNATDTFLRDLIDGRLEDQAAIEERSRYAGIPFEKRFCLFCIDADERSVPTARLIADVARMVAPAKTILYHGSIVVLCFNCREAACARACAEGSCPSQSRAVSRRLEALLERFDALCGRSSEFAELSETRAAYLQARAAAAHARQPGLLADELHGARSLPRIRCFDDCCVQYLAQLDGADGGPDLATRTGACAVLAGVLDHDRAHGTDNYRFLFHYLHGERRASVVAERMHMHRNNVKYRIDRIEQTFGLDLSDAALRFELMAAYRILDGTAQASLVQRAQGTRKDCGRAG